MGVWKVIRNNVVSVMILSLEKIAFSQAFQTLVTS